MALQFTKEEVEEGLAGTLGELTRKEIARKSGLSESYIKRQFNSNDELQTAAFQTLLIACAIRDLDEETGEKFWNAFLSFYELSKPRKPNQKSPSAFDCLAEKLHLDGAFGSTLTQALQDGKLDRKEIKCLSEMVDQLRKLCDLFDTMMNFALSAEENFKG